MKLYARLKIASLEDKSHAWRWCPHGAARYMQRSGILQDAWNRACSGPSVVGHRRLMTGAGCFDRNRFGRYVVSRGKSPWLD